MRNHQHPWNLRRIFGRQFVGYVGRPSCLKAGIAARVISAQSSRWTSREPEDADLPTCRLADLPTCRLADLPTCRLADLPTWSWMTNGIPARAFSSGYSSSVSSTFRRIIEGSASNRGSTTLRLFPSPSNCPKVSFGVIARHHLPPVNPPSQWKQRGTVECPYFSLPKQ